MKREPLPLDFSVPPLSRQRRQPDVWDILRDGQSILHLKVGAVDLDRGLVMALDLPTRVDPVTRKPVWRYLDGRFELFHLPTGTLCRTNAEALALAEGAG